MSGALDGVFTALQERLAAQLSASRTALAHPVALGDASENNWLDMLDAHLPLRYRATKGLVIDAAGGQSQAIDLIIYDRQYTPLLYNQAGQRILPAEAVYAVFEVKQHLGKRYIEYAGEKAASVRNLRRTSAQVVHAGGRHEPREPFRILAGLLTFDSDWTPAFGEPFRNLIDALPEAHRLDLGCVVTTGAVEITYSKAGPASLRVSPQETGLAEFFLRLLARLQTFGTVSAIDYRAYGAALGLDDLGD